MHVCIQLTVSDSEGDGADVVCHDSVGHVYEPLVFLAQLSPIHSAAADTLNGCEYRHEDVGVVVRVLAYR